MKQLSFPKKKYGIIYADPPWKYEFSYRKHDSVEYHYPSMDLEELKSLPVNKLAAEDCMLFLWATMPKLKEALEVMTAWGFKYITCAFVWVKLNPKGVGIYSGLGHWVNGNAEIVLLGRKGNPVRRYRAVKQIIHAPRREHSRKPDEIRYRIVKLLGNISRIELFARQKVPGWDAWGNEIKRRETKWKVHTWD